MKLSTKAIIGVAAVPVLLLGLTAALFEALVIPREVEGMVHRARTVVGALQVAAERAGPEAAQGVVEALAAREPDLAYAIVVDRDGVATVHSEPGRVGMRFADPGTLAAARDGREVQQLYVRDANDPASPHHGERTLDLLVPLTDADGRTTGAANVGLSLARVDAVKLRYRLALLGFGVVLALLAFLFARRVLREFVAPLATLAEAARRVERGDFEVELPPDRFDEIGILVGDFRSMSREIRSLVSRLQERERDLQESVHALRRSEARYRTLAEHASDLIYIVREDRALAYANQAVARRIGRPVSELIGRKADELFLPAVVEPIERLFWRAIGADGPVRAEAMLPRTLGEGTVWYDTIGVRLVEEDGGRAVLFITRDISERKEMEARLLAADRMVSMGTLAAGVAHEINNPLSYVLANLQMLFEDFEENSKTLPDGIRAEVRAMLEESLEGAKRVRSIVRDLKTFSRDDPEERAAVDVHAMLDASIRMAGNQVRHRARLVKEYGTLPVIEASAKLGQVFVNLLVNAAQAIPDGHAEANEIVVATRVEGERVVVEIADTGCGIREADLPRIFQPFFTTKRQGEGTGLGLSICQGIVRRLGGDITVESRVGKGSTFRVSLPIGHPEASPAAPPEPVGPRESGRILVVDDESAVCRAIAASLADHRVTAVTFAREALRRIEEGERFDLVLCDLMMPEMTGAELHDAIVRIAPEQAKRMVFLSGGAFGADAVAFLERVPNLRLEKPFVVDALRATVARLLATA